MLSRHAPTTGSDAACTCQIRPIGVLRCSHGIQLQLLVRCGQRGGTPPIPTIPLYVNLPPGSGVVGVRQSRPLGRAPQGGGRFTHVIFTKTASNRMIRTSRHGPRGRRTSSGPRSTGGGSSTSQAMHASSYALQTSLIYVYALQMRTPCSSTRTGKRTSRRSQADSSCAFIMFVCISILAGWLHQNNSNEWAEGSLRLEVEEEARDLEFISDCKQNWLLLRPHRTSRKSPSKRHGLKSASAT